MNDTKICGTSITPQALEAAGWNKNRGGRYWKTYRPSWRSEEKRHECSIRVVFNDDYFPNREFMVWLAGGGLVVLPRIKTMEQLDNLFELVGEEE